MSEEKEEVPLKPVNFEQGNTLLDQADNQVQSKQCCKMERPVKIAVAALVSITVIGLTFGLAFGIDWSNSGPVGPVVEPVTSEPIEGRASNYLKIQDPKNGKDYFKFVPRIKAQGGNTLRNVTFKDFLDMIGSDQDFLDDFIDILKSGSGFDQYYFECKPIKKSTFDSEKFEFVLKKADGLANRDVDFKVFEDELNNCQDDSVSFDYGLRKDSTLVCPCLPQNAEDQPKYTHLATFVKDAPKPALNSVLKKAAQVMTEKVTQSSDADQKWYLSTDGSGTAWLHFRVGKRAKYYSYDEYRFADL